MMQTCANIYSSIVTYYKGVQIIVLHSPILALIPDLSALLRKQAACCAEVKRLSLMMPPKGAFRLQPHDAMVIQRSNCLFMAEPSHAFWLQADLQPLGASVTLISIVNQLSNHLEPTEWTSSLYRSVARWAVASELWAVLSLKNPGMAAFVLQVGNDPVHSGARLFNGTAKAES